jgi:hypothetical protein
MIICLQFEVQDLQFEVQEKVQLGFDPSKLTTTEPQHSIFNKLHIKLILVNHGLSTAIWKYSLRNLQRFPALMAISVVYELKRLY